MNRLGHYDLLEPIGSGGMGVVYRARDARLGRIVALKVLPDAASADPARRARFLNEARACAALLHRHIATLFEYGEVEQPSGPPRLFLAMEYVEGDDLSGLLAAGPLPVGRALQIGRQIATALDVAHRHGIVHRDLKPGNVRLAPDGEVKVLDFGLAKLVAAGDETIPDGFRTREGVLMGTPPYLAPEQASGQRVDARADLFSLGVVLFEMLTGRRPWRGRDFLEYLRELESGPAPDLRGLVPGGDDARLATLVSGLLQKDPETRIQSAADAERELSALEVSWSAVTGAPTSGPEEVDRAPRPRQPWSSRRVLAILVATALALFAVAAALRWLPVTARGEPAIGLALAVAPFDNLSGDPGLDFVARGMSLALSGDLANLPDARVVDSSVAAAYTADPALQARLAADHDVAQLLRGRVQRQDERILVGIDLVDLDSGRVAWSLSFEGRAGRLLELQESVVRGVGGGLRDRLSRRSRSRLEQEPTSSNEAYEAHLHGLQFGADPSGPADLEVAIHFFERALELDPHFVYPRVQLAEALLDLYSLDLDPAALRRARIEAERALEQRPDLADARLALARALRLSGEPERARGLLAGDQRAGEPAPQLSENRPFELLIERAYQERPRDPVAATALLREAVESAPEAWQAWSALGIDSMRARRWAEAEAELERSLALGPDNQETVSNLAAVLLSQGKHTEVVALAQRVGGPITHASLASNVGFAHYLLDDLDRAEQHFRLAARLRPSDERLLTNLGDVLQRLERPADAQREYLGALALVESRLRAFPELAGLHAQQALLLAKGGRCTELAAVDLSGLAADEPAAWSRAAKAFALCGDHTAALRHVTRALQAGEAPGVLRAAEELAALRDDPAFRRLVGEPR